MSPVEGDTAVVGAPLAWNPGVGGTGLAFVYTRSGSTWSRAATLAASDGGASDQFGNSVAIENGTIVVGSPQDDDKGGNAGAVYVFTGSGSTWTQQVKLTGSDHVGTEYLGYSVGLAGNTIVGGAYNDNDGG